METKLHLIAREPGSYEGLSTKFSGECFSDIHFKDIATSEDGFKDWIAKATQVTLDGDSYKALAQPSQKVPVSYYGQVAPDLFAGVLNRHMGDMPHGEMPMDSHHDMSQAGMPMDMHHHEDGDAVSSNITPAKAEK
jgi:cytochrome o ubiquinol oxidase subunit 2